MTPVLEPLASMLAMMLAVTALILVTVSPASVARATGAFTPHEMPTMTASYPAE